LYWINLNDNRLRKLPESLSLLSSLKKLGLVQNMLKELPKNFGLLQNLQKVDIRRNRIGAFPSSIRFMRKLDCIVYLPQIDYQEETNQTSCEFPTLRELTGRLIICNKMRDTILTEKKNPSLPEIYFSPSDGYKLPLSLKFFLDSFKLCDVCCHPYRSPPLIFYDTISRKTILDGEPRTLSINVVYELCSKTCKEKYMLAKRLYIKKDSDEINEYSSSKLYPRMLLSSVRIFESSLEITCSHGRTLKLDYSRFGKGSLMKSDGILKSIFQDDQIRLSGHRKSSASLDHSYEMTIMNLHYLEQQKNVKYI
jgi:hypothetical protein